MIHTNEHPHQSVPAGRVVPFKGSEPKIFTVVPASARAEDDLACYISQQKLGSSIRPGDTVIVRTNFDDAELTNRSVVVVECSRRGLMLERFGTVKPLVDIGLTTPPPPHKTLFNIELRGVAIAVLRELR